MGYIPDRGDAIRLNVDLWAGHRPALVISPASYNEVADLALVGSITNTVGRY
jgi:mRNA-degrading endonuclease toxin of MazEF toxin-antitoxin module